MSDITRAIDHLEGEEYSGTVRKTWQVPAKVAELLHQWSEVETGSRDNIGVVVTRAMENQGDESDWTPRKFEEVDTTPTGFRVAEEVAADYTRGLGDEYGRELANTIMAEFYRTHQIDSREAAGDVDITSVTMGDTLSLSHNKLDVLLSDAARDAIDYRARRGLELARIRHDESITREQFTTEFEERFDISRRSSRKDLRKIVDEVRDSGTLMLSPVEQLKRELNQTANPLSQTLGVQVGDEPIIVADENGERWSEFIRTYSEQVCDEVIDKEHRDKHKHKKEQLRNAKRAVERSQELKQATNALIQAAEGTDSVDVQRLVGVRDIICDTIASIKREEYINGLTLHERADAVL